jgi:UDP-N-acetyl-D-glucosamine dehydrogenase
MIVVHGLGYVGLVSATAFALAGQRVLGYDPDRAVVYAVNAGHPRAGEFLGYLDADVKTMVADGRLRATATLGDTMRDVCRTHLIAVPTEKDGRPHDAIVLDVLERLFVKHGAMPLTVIVESTLTPGTIDRFLAAHPEVREYLRDGSALAAAPRRDWLCDREKNLATLPRVVGGVTPRCTERAMEVLAPVSPRLLPTDYRTAELTKAVENALLHTSVMLGYQLATAFPEDNIAEVLRLASTHWRFASLGPLYLGFGSGGRCIPLGAKYLLEGIEPITSEGDLSMADEALNADDAFRSLIANTIRRAGAKSALVLGVAYRPEFKDAGLSPGLAVARRLAAQGVKTAVHDAHWTQEELRALAGDSITAVNTGFSFRDYDAVLLATPHREYLDWPAQREGREGWADWSAGQIVLDGQGAWAMYSSFFRAAGVRYAQVGTPGWMTP